MAQRITLSFLALMILFAQPAAAADFELGMAAYNAKDYKAAFGEWKPLAEQGHAEAQFNLGILYAEGQGVAADKKEGIRWWRKAAELGNVDSQIYLGAMYYDGLDLAKDYPRSYMWFKIAADSGDHQAASLRRVVADFMTAAQQTEARRLVQECRAKNFKGC
jgi:TPR repeat protein